MLLGALAASLFMGGPTRRAAGSDAKDGAEDEWLRRDRGPALLVAAFAFFLIFAALEYDYNLLGEVTKFSAGPVVSLELAQPAQNAKDTGNSGSRLSGSLVAAAQPRTQSINYVTDQLKQISDFIDEDDRTAQVFSGVEAQAEIDPLVSKIKPLLHDCIQPLGVMLDKLQTGHSSEFPSINGIEIAAANDNLSNTKDLSVNGANNERIVLMSSLLMRRVYDGVSKFIDPRRISNDHITVVSDQDLFKYANTATKDFASAIGDYNTSVKLDYSILDKKDDVMASDEPQCTTDKTNIMPMIGLNVRGVEFGKIKHSRLSSNAYCSR